ncbi:related to alcohol oxidase [Fusarium torulosum]|uniref:Related to alcohol oxidase n=1 Tax=Fusarium torulosum TaxID=33205 RepID=A0AAE8M9W9_9HYPO|nr:related to alcohol oxidase [Fusarium torulosum]
MAQIRTVEEFSHLSFDFIVIGGGTAGLAIAARLAEADASYTIGVIEAGGLIQDDPDISIPGHYGRSLGGSYDWHLETVPQQGLGNRKLPWPRGKALGGTSALNYMAWNRASKDDYDAWEALGNPGWGWEGLLPFFKRSETFHPPSERLQSQHEVSHDADTFGESGPIHISYPTDYSPSHQLWHRTLNALGVQTNPSHVGGSNVGVWTCVNAVEPHSARRSYSIDYCETGPANLHILTHATVNEVLINDQKIATGVRFSYQGVEYEVAASREIILSAGSVKSPQILELSGVGNPQILERAGIPVKVDSPNVGENLQEHIMLATIFEVDPSLANRDDLLKDDKLAVAARDQYTQTADGPLTILPVSLCYVPLTHFVPSDILASLHAEADNLSAFDPDKQDILRQRLNGSSNLGQIEYIFDLGIWNPYFKGEEGKKYGTMLQILQYPFSVGSIHIRPSSNGSATAEQSPAIDPQYYEGAHGKLDMEVMKQCLQFVNKIAHTEPLANIIRAPASPSAADFKDDKRLEDWVTQNTITDWHPVGTCAMGGRAGIEGGVVDERLRVYGVQGLRVVDASIMPLQISAHIQATIYAIAEKAAHMIIEDARSTDMLSREFSNEQARL